MTAAPPLPAWTPLSLLKHRFAANVAALASREPALADRLRLHAPEREYSIQAFADHLRLGIGPPATVQPLPLSLLPGAARDLTQKLFPGGMFNQPVLVTGEDLGWLWNNLYQLPCNVPTAPGHRPPLFLLLKDIERLRVMLHIQDWQKLLADRRVRLFVGPDAFEQFRRSLVEDSMCPCPALSVTVDQTLWPVGLTLDSLRAWVKAGMSERLALATTRMRELYCGLPPDRLASLMHSGKPLNILGVTSRYTTFLQYSMRGWLTGFERLGHRVRLVIESFDHLIPNNLALAEACVEFKPDLVVLIDHHRKEMGGLPDEVPVAMWAQDYMPNIYCPEGAAAQGPHDYVLGFAYEKLRLVHELGYPGERYLTATIGTDPNRFAPQPASDPRLLRYACDVCFVTNASVPAEQIVQEQIDRNGTPQAKKLLGSIFDQIRAVYDSDKTVVAPPAIRRIIDQGFIDSRTNPTPELLAQLTDLFYMRVNNALFRHQSLRWLVEQGVDLRLYGRGWENNPSFRQFARGVADNESELSLIYQASRINLHISPLGSLHQRVMEGLASGGFFLLRRGDGDILGRYYARIWDFCQRAAVTTDEQLRACTDPALRDALEQVTHMHQCDPFAEKHTFMQLVQTMHDCDYLCSAGCVWGTDFDQTSFASKAELQSKVAHFLANPLERERLSRSMLQPVLERFSYEKTSSRLLAMIAADQTRAAGKAPGSPASVRLAA